MRHVKPPVHPCPWWHKCKYASNDINQSIRRIVHKSTRFPQLVPSHTPHKMTRIRKTQYIKRSYSKQKNTTKVSGRLKENKRKKGDVAQSSASDDESGVYLETVGSERRVFKKLSVEEVRVNLIRKKALCGGSAS
jgi:hypothetical protein